MKRFFLSLISALMTWTLYGQIVSKDSSLTISGLIDVYYSFQSNKPFTGESQYTFAYHRHNEINLNVGMLKVAYEKNRIRGNLALQTGTYARANYAAEPEEYRMINEANVGVKLAKHVWFDVGIMPSHIGVESFDATQCYTLTRSLMADGSPYFLTAAKLSYEPNDKFSSALLVTNGFQTIQENNDTKLYGLQLTYSPTQKITLNYSNLIGDEYDQSDFIFFHDFWIEYREITKGLKATVVFDYMHIDDFSLTNASENALTGALLLYYDLDKVGFGARVEHYNDERNFIFSTPFSRAFITQGYSLNVDIKISENALFRMEGRYLNSKNSVFNNGIPIPAFFPNENSFFRDVQVEDNSFIGTAALQISF